MSKPRLNANAVRGEARKAGDTSHLSIARKIGVGQSTVSRLLAGRTSPSARTLLALHHAYGIPLDGLLEGSEDTASAKEPPKPLPVAA